MGILNRLFGPPDIEQLTQSSDAKGLLRLLTRCDHATRIRAALALRKLMKQSPARRESLPAFSQTLAEVAKKLQSPLTDVATQTAELLGELGDPEAVEPLLRVLKVAPSRVRITAVTALAKIPGRQSVDTLIALLGNSKEDRFLRGAAATGLGNLSDRSAIEPLVTAFETDESKGRTLATHALFALRKLLDSSAEGQMLTSDEADAIISRAKAYTANAET
jgi:HEAT repeat protein